MKKAIGGWAACGLLFTMSLAAQKNQTFTGEIMDSQCAALGGHEKMLDKGETLAHCTIECVKGGGKYVLYNGKDKTTYVLDDQKKPVAFAGAKVTVMGTLDKATSTIHVADIKAAAGK